MECLTNDVGSDERTYRAYVIGRDDRIQNAIPVEAPNDELAVLAARNLVDGHAIELWDRGRKFVRFEAKD